MVMIWWIVRWWWLYLRSGCGDSSVTLMIAIASCTTPTGWIFYGRRMLLSCLYVFPRFILALYPGLTHSFSCSHSWRLNIIDIPPTLIPLILFLHSVSCHLDFGSFVLHMLLHEFIVHAFLYTSSSDSYVITYCQTLRRPCLNPNILLMRSSVFSFRSPVITGVTNTYANAYISLLSSMQRMADPFLLSLRSALLVLSTEHIPSYVLSREQDSSTATSARTSLPSLTYVCVLWGRWWNNKTYQTGTSFPLCIICMYVFKNYCM